MTEKIVLRLLSLSLFILLFGCVKPPPPVPPTVPDPINANIGVHLPSTGTYHCTDGKAPTLVESGLGQLNVVVMGNTTKPFGSIAYYRKISIYNAVFDASSGYQGGGTIINKISPQSSGDDIVYLALPITGDFNISLQYMEWPSSYPSSSTYGNLSSCFSTPPMSGNCWKWHKAINLGSGTVPNFATTGNLAHHLTIDLPWDEKGGNCLVY